MVSMRAPVGMPAEPELEAKGVLLVSDAPEPAAALCRLLLAAGCRSVETISQQSAGRAVQRQAELVIRCERYEAAAPWLRAAGGGAKYGLADIIGASAAVAALRRRMELLAQVDGPVLIAGETGTGKELVAHALHGLSRRCDQPFVAVNMAAIPETLLESELFGYVPGSFTGARRQGHAGKFVQANGGTIFLDEVGDIPLALQGKLLRVLQEQEVDRIGGRQPLKLNVRVISATHRPLSDLVAQGRFRADLYYRLNVLNLEVPALRERAEDVRLLAEHFLAELAQQYGRRRPGLTEQAVECLCRHRWPGNVRELRNAMEHAFTFADADQVQATHLPVHVLAALRQSSGAPAARRQEAEQWLRLLEEESWNKAALARRLGISRSGLYLKLRQLGVLSR